MRIMELDVVKGIGIILVVFAHCIQCGSGNEYYSSLHFFDNILYKIIYSFHMPLLMIISGYLFANTIKKISFFEIVARKFQQLIVPIFIWQMAIFARHLLSTTPITVLNEWILSSLNSFWFLWAAFFASMYTAFVYKVCNNINWLYLLGIIVSMITPDIFNSECYKFMYVMFLVGFFANEFNYKYKLDQMNYKKIIGIVVIYAYLLLIWKREAYIYIGGWSCLKDSFSEVIQSIIFNIYRSVIGIIGSIIVLWIGKKATDRFVDSLIVKVVVQLGKMTMGIYIISTYLNSILQKITMNSNYNLLMILFETIIIILICVFAIIIIRKIPIGKIILLGEYTSNKRKVQ